MGLTLVRLILELDSGVWVTNSIQSSTFIWVDTPPGSNGLVYVDIPKNAKRWMVQGVSCSYQRHNLRLETMRSIPASGAVNHIPIFMGNFLWEFLATNSNA